MRVRTRDLAAREEKLEALQQKLTESVGALVSGEDWKRALEFAAKFRGRSFGNTMLIAVTAYDATEDRRRAKLAGFDSHMAKPIDFEDLKEVLGRSKWPR